MSERQDNLATRDGGESDPRLSTICVVCHQDINGQEYLDRHSLVSPIEGDAHERCCPCMGE